MTFIDTADSSLLGVDDLLGFPDDVVIRDLAGTSDRLRKGDFIGTYEVTRVTRQGNHNDVPAITATLALNGTEVGRLILVPTEGTMGYLPITRVFADQQAWDRFVYELANAIPEGCVRIPARAVLKDDVLVEDGDDRGTVVNEPRLDVLNDGTVEVVFQIRGANHIKSTPLGYDAARLVTVRRAA